MMIPKYNIGERHYYCQKYLDYPIIRQVGIEQIWITEKGIIYHCFDYDENSDSCHVDLLEDRILKTVEQAKAELELVKQDCIKEIDEQLSKFEAIIRKG